MATYSRIEVAACAICGDRAATVQGRCDRCHQYRKRTGHERPVWLKPYWSLCRICQERPVATAARCTRCNSYYRKHGVERPLTVKSQRPYAHRYTLCRNGCPMAAVAHDRCVTCYRWYRRHGYERQKLDQRPGRPARS